MEQVLDAAIPAHLHGDRRVGPIAQNLAHQLGSDSAGTQLDEHSRPGLIVSLNLLDKSDFADNLLAKEPPNLIGIGRVR